MTKRRKTTLLIIYSIIFYSLWTITELFIFNKLNLIIKNDITLELLKSGVIKNLIWTLPAILLIHYFDKDVYISLKQMFLSRVNWLKHLPIFLFFTVWVLAGSVLQAGKFQISNSFGIDELIIVLFVGITEEMVFRGWLLNATFCQDKKWLCILINAIMFLVIHFPIWISEGVFISSFTSFGFLSNIMLSVIFSCTFIKSKSILVPIILHMYWDLLVFMFIG